MGPKHEQRWSCYWQVCCWLTETLQEDCRCVWKHPYACCADVSQGTLTNVQYALQNLHAVLINQALGKIQTVAVKYHMTRGTKYFAERNYDQSDS